MRDAVLLGVLLLLVRATARCGDGVLEAGEACDDGNRAAGDGCDADCATEAGFLCEARERLPGVQTTACCPARTHPVSGTVVCNCVGARSPSDLYRVTAACALEDVDECATAGGGCAANALCVNLDGRPPASEGFACVCAPGLTGDGYVACGRTRYTVEVHLAVSNATEPGNHLPATWLAARAGELAGAEAWLADAAALHDVGARYLVGTGARRAGAAADHVVIVFEVASWDAMQELAAAANAALLADFLTGLSAGLNQIAVLQDATTVVEEALDGYTYIAEHSPGLLLTNISYAAVPVGEWDATQHVWRVTAQFYRPPELLAALFLSKGSAGAPAGTQPCAETTDVCCLHRMLSAYHLGDFGAWVAAHVSPRCPGGVPDADTASRASAEVLAELQLQTWTEGVVDGFQAAGVQTPTRDTLILDVSQADVVARLAPPPEGDTYTFTLGMLFLRPLSVPALHVVIGQATVRVFASSEVTFVASSQQSYSFLEFLDVALYELDGVALARVRLQLPADVHNGSVPVSSVQLTRAADVSAIDAWGLACHSAEATSERDGSALWDANETRVRYATAFDAPCALPRTHFCALTEVAGLHVIDIPLGVGGLAAGPPALFLRFAVRAERAAYELVTQVDLQLLVAPGTVQPLCTDALQSGSSDANFVHVAVAIGAQLEASDGDTRDTVLFTDVTNSLDYAALQALDTGLAYSAVSAIDSLITVALLGEVSFFSQSAQASAEVVFDHVVTVHLRSESKYTAMRSLVSGGEAYLVRRGDDGFFHVMLTDALLELCYGASRLPDPTPDENLDCAVQYPVSRRVVQPALARLVGADDEANAAWFAGRFGDSPFMSQVATDFILQTRAHFDPDGRSRKALWVSPTFPWPGATALGASDRTLLFAAFAVAR